MFKLNKENVILDLKARNKGAVLEELAEGLHHQCPQIDLPGLCRALAEREQVGSTGVGNGVAIPHGKVRGLDRIQLFVGRSLKGISFDAVDNQSVYLFVMIISPVDMAEEYLKTLARVSRLLKRVEKRRLLLHAQSRQEIVDIFNQS